VENGIVKQVIVSTKDGQTAFEADVFIDCTGDGDLAIAPGRKLRSAGNLTAH
jgi:hypothetical protein